MNTKQLRLHNGRSKLASRILIIYKSGAKSSGDFLLQYSR